MAEEIRTGGTRKFVSKDRPELEPELASKIEEGYKRAEERKRIERKRKIIKILIGAGAIILITIFLLIYYSI